MKKIFLLISLFTFIFHAENAISANPLMKYESDVEKIISKALADSSAYKRLEYLCDTYGHRLSGSQSLELAINWIFAEMQKDGLTNVRMDPVMVPNWKRNREHVEMIYPRVWKMEMMSLGGSVSTPAEGLRGEVFVVSSKDELLKNQDKAKGKIVIFNMPFTGYGETVQYRFNGAVWAAEAGAIASGIRSVSPIGMNNPHTGMMGYKEGVTKIPHIAFTAEDVEMMHRLQKQGVKPWLHLFVSSETLPDALSHNVMGEYKGTENPEEIISLGGHIDSWDAGQGAHDDAGGCLATWSAVKLLKDLGLTTKRTIRAVMWTNEENGLMGGKAYAEKYKNEKHTVAIEMDGGVFKPAAMRFTASNEFLDKVKNMEPLLKKLRAEMKVGDGGGGADIGPLQKLGFPVGSIHVDDGGKYFWYHHSPSDTFDKIDYKDFNECVAALAITIYLIGNM